MLMTNISPSISMRKKKKTSRRLRSQRTAQFETSRPGG